VRVTVLPPIESWRLDRRLEGFGLDEETGLEIDIAQVRELGFAELGVGMKFRQCGSNIHVMEVVDSGLLGSFGGVIVFMESVAVFAEHGIISTVQVVLATETHDHQQKKTDHQSLTHVRPRSERIKLPDAFGILFGSKWQVRREIKIARVKLTKAQEEQEDRAHVNTKGC
jgi:hypothetical protein